MEQVPPALPIRSDLAALPMVLPLLSPRNEPTPRNNTGATGASSATLLATTPDSAEFATRSLGSEYSCANSTMDSSPTRRQPRLDWMDRGRSPFGGPGAGGNGSRGPAHRPAKGKMDIRLAHLQTDCGKGNTPRPKKEFIPTVVLLKS